MIDIDLILMVLLPILESLVVDTIQQLLLKVVDSCLLLLLIDLESNFLLLLSLVLVRGKRQRRS